MHTGIKLSEGSNLQRSPCPERFLRELPPVPPFAQIGGETIDWLDPKTFKYTINYERLD